MSQFIFSPIGLVHSPYKEKFAIPRQPGLVDSGDSFIKLCAPYNQKEMVRGLEQFSHLWVIFVFHQTMEQGWHPTVRPPRLGGNERMGVLATRSTFRPNPIGLSLVKLKTIRYQNNDIFIDLTDIDLVDGTPVLDIKPYLPFAESISQANAGFAQNAPEALLSTIFSPEAEQALQIQAKQHPNLRQFISQVLAQDPRPAYHKTKAEIRDYAVHLYDVNIRWRVIDDVNHVFAIEAQ